MYYGMLFQIFLHSKCFKAFLTFKIFFSLMNYFNMFIQIWTLSKTFWAFTAFEIFSSIMNDLICLRKLDLHQGFFCSVSVGKWSSDPPPLRKFWSNDPPPWARKNREISSAQHPKKAKNRGSKKFYPLKTRFLDDSRGVSGKFFLEPKIFGKIDFYCIEEMTYILRTIFNTFTKWWFWGIKLLIYGWNSLKYIENAKESLLEARFDLSQKLHLFENRQWKSHNARSFPLLLYP